MGITLGSGDKRMDLLSGKEKNVSWSPIEFEGRRRERIKDSVKVTFLDKLADSITTKRERKKDKVSE